MNRSRLNLQDEIERRKQELAKRRVVGSLANAVTPNTSSPSTVGMATTTDDPPAPKRSKYMKRSEIKQYRKPTVAPQPSPRTASAAETDASTNPENPPLKTGTDSPVSTHNTSVPTNDHTANEKDPLAESDALYISAEETIRRLRAKGQPIRLFGETDYQRSIRLRALELIEDHTEGGQRNDFMKTLEEMESGLALEALQRQAGGHGDTSYGAGGNHGDLTGADPLAAQNQLPGDGGGTRFMDEYDTTQISPTLLKTDPDLAYTLVYVYLKRLVYEWQDALDARPESVRNSAPGKRIAATQRQSSDYLKPLFKLLKRKAADPDVMAKLVDIVALLQAREYVQANSVYLQLSIGNAPWPIGVTMVGIHERSGRSKIASNQVAHALNDETQRKWIQSLKRLMTFAQTKYPPDDLAKAAG
ncbi:hypothetical protein IWQ60_010389 [Tieghemiomyces parasiticus]|uniref:Pre-mRNA-splicing factor 18 n=1 Tax=Tieghemiomyces parasiticus TaxID=78921 RepID=A0A9W7ZQY8_9FUNG|nr:hypothetical protein IWQ60_010389 [Tieghemiomyces parasiticus]